MGKNKVYISSTYRDLREHRQKVIEFFSKKTIRENFELVSMEGYVADSVTPSTECMQDVEQCNIYILILANRYGFIPVDAATNPLRLSITELEYRTAQSDPEKIILAYFADESDAQFAPDSDDDESLTAEKKGKLVAFKKLVKDTKLTHPEPFISAYHLALQIAESLMRKSFIAYKLDESRKYCCDRIPQFTRFLQVRNKGRFKTVVITGQRSELGLNLINRFSIFILNLTETDVVPPLTFEEFLSSDDYELCRNDLLVAIYYKLFNNYDLEDVSIPSFLEAIKALEKPLIFVINSEAKMFEDRQLAFLQRFIDELYNASLTAACENIYLFLNFENSDTTSTIADGKGSASAGMIDAKINQLKQSLPNADKCLSVLPPLQSLSPALIRNWLFSFVTPDQGRVDELMDLCFPNLSVPLSMRMAEKGIQQFIQRVNEQDESILKIIN